MPKSCKMDHDHGRNLGEAIKKADEWAKDTKAMLYDIYDAARQHDTLPESLIMKSRFKKVYITS